MKFLLVLLSIVSLVQAVDLAMIPTGDGAVVAARVPLGRDAGEDFARESFGWASAERSDPWYVAAIKAPARHVMLNKGLYTALTILTAVDRVAYNNETLWYNWDFTGLEPKADKPTEMPLSAGVPAPPEHLVYIQGDNNIVIIQYSYSGNQEAQNDIPQ